MKMTINKHNRIIAYLAAIVSIIASCLFWTNAVKDTSADSLHLASNIFGHTNEWELKQAYTLSIPRLELQAPVLLPSLKYWQAKNWDLLEEQMQIGMSQGLVAYPHSTAPSDKGALIVAGHSSPPDERAAKSPFGSIFSRLPELEVGDEISVMQNGRQVIFAIESKVVVPPSATKLLEQQNTDNILKLITCFPIGTTKDRMIITAKRVGLRNL